MVTCFSHLADRGTTEVKALSLGLVLFPCLTRPLTIGTSWSAFGCT